jgi:hypothetical protein
MGRITKPFSAKTRVGKVSGEARIDTGADRTLIAYPLACQLGLDTATAPGSVMSSASGQRMIGFSLDTYIQVDARKARVRAFVPMFTIGEKNKMRKLPPRNLIGHDFLQKSGGKLDYSKPHEEVFSGGKTGWPFDWTFSNTVSPQERRALMAVPCRRKR